MHERQSQEQRKAQFKTLMKAIRRDPQEGLRRFYVAYSKIIHTTACVICRSSTDKVNEVVNDVLVKIWKQAAIIKDIDNPEGWVYIITANTAKDAMKEQYVFSLDENMLADEKQIQEIVDKDSFYWMIKDLSEVEQKIMIHKFILRYTFQDMAAEWKKPLTTVTSIYYRALEKIKKNMKEKI